MIERAEPPLDASTARPANDSAASARSWIARCPADLSRLALVVCWTSGPDPLLDGVFKASALRREAHGWTHFERFADPFPRPAGAGSDRVAHADDAERRVGSSARMAREYGVTGRDLEGANPWRAVWEELEEFLGDRPLLVAERAGHEAWASAAGLARPRALVAFDELAALCFPARLAGLRGESAVRAFLAAAAPHALPLTPVDLGCALAALAARFLDQDERVLGLAAHGWAQAHAALRARAGEQDLEAASELALALALLERPPADLPGAARETLAARAGRLAVAERRASGLATALEDVHPPWAAEDAALEPLDPLPPDHPRPAEEDGAPAAEPDQSAPGAPGTPSAPGSTRPLRTDLALADADFALVDAVFREHLPALGTRHGTPFTCRDGQRAVANRVAHSLGTGELLLVHAPTGTGKTLAYLVPALLFAARHGLRVGVATFTRALQEQAAERELPRALAALAAAGLDPLPRTAVLKGRQNYLCWRALKLTAPQPSLFEDGPAAVLAWTQAALFALSDPEGDLDRLSLAPRLPGFRGGARAGALARELARLAREARAEAGCCSLKADRRNCAAEVARRRAERAHLVLTNHALALQKRDFLKHVIFDECEHLHDQAQSAFSHEITLAEGREILGRLKKPGERSERLPLARLERQVPPGSEARDTVDAALEAQARSLGALDALEYRLHAFLSWREEALSGRTERDGHSLFREYAGGPLGAELIAAQQDSCAALADLASALAEIAESLDALPLRGAGRLRRALDRARVELDEWTQGMRSWLPVVGEAAQFSPETFYDVVRDAADVRLVARVLLPHEFLGRHYYPELAGAAFVSATTWIRGGFDAQSLYLGLARAALPAVDEARAAVPLSTFRAGEVFDYGRVLVAVPQDAPALRGDSRSLHLEYVRNFVAHLAERTRGRLLVLFTNAEDCARVGRGLERFFAERSIPFWYQRMPGVSKEELATLFRARTDSVLLGLDTFWYGADFPGETLEYLAIVRLPFGVPDAYHHAQCAAIGAGEQRGAIYMPKALAKFRQGFGRLMRRESDRGVVFLLDGRVLEPKNRGFLRELPLAGGSEPDGARCVRGTTDECLGEAFAHMGLAADIKRRGLDVAFWQRQLPFAGREHSSPGD